MAFFFVFGIGQTFFLDLLLLTKKNKRISDYILAFWFLIMGLHLVAFYIFWSEIYLENPYLLGWDQPFPLIHGPLLLFYVLSLTKENFKINWKYLLHFLPAFCMYLALIPIALGGKESILNFVDQVQSLNLPWYYQPFAWLTQFSILGYSIYCLWILRKHRENIADKFAYQETISLNWLRYLIYGLLVIGMIIAIGIGLEVYWAGEYLIQKEIWIFSAVIIWILYGGYYGIKQQSIFGNKVQPIQNQSIQERKPAFRQYQNSGLKEAEAERLSKELKSLMESEKPYLEPRLTLNELSQKLDILPNHLSQLINEKEEMNFYQFINHYRVEEFKERVGKPEAKNLSLLGLAMDCGFNSKSSFNSVFKSNTGMTPSQYVKSLKSPEKTS